MRSRGGVPRPRVRLKRWRSRRRRLLWLPGEACRHCAADALKAGQYNGALRRTGCGAPELDLKRPEQSLKLVQRAVPPPDALAKGLVPRRRATEARKGAAVVELRKHRY
jgi:hypothetical protein